MKGSSLRRVQYLPVMLIFAWVLWDFVPRRLPRPELLDALPVPVEASVEDVQPAELLARMRAAYLAAETFRVESWIRSVRISGDDRDVRSVEHSRLALHRPDRLVWQWRETFANRRRENLSTDLRQDGTDVRFRSTRWGEAKPKGRRDALGMLGFQSRGSLPLLFPQEVRRRHMSEGLRDVHVVGVERFDGHDCFRTEGVWPDHAGGKPAEYVLWIDCSSYTLRRLFVRAHIADWILEMTHVFSPEAGCEIPDAELGLDESF